MPSARIRAAVLGLAVPAVLALTAAPAAAHNELLASSPKQGAALTALPAEIKLRFAEEADPRFVKIAATGPGGTNVAAGAPTIDSAVVTQPLTQGTASGTYTLAYRVVSKDGHPVSGKVTFTATVPATTASPTVSPSPTEEPAEVPPAPKKAATATEDKGNGWMFYAAIGIGVVLLSGLALGLRSRASRTG